MEANNIEEYKKILDEKSLRNSMKEELADSARIRIFNDDWSKVLIREVNHKKFKKLEGRNLKDIASEENAHAFDWLLDHSLSEGGMDTLFVAMLLNTEEKEVGKLLKSDQSTIALSDAGAHLTFFCDAGYGLHMLKHWVKNKNLMSIEEAIYRLSGRQADIYRIDQRGRLVAGQYADILMIDLDQIGVSVPFKKNDLPGGSSRLTAKSFGVKGVWVNGVRVVDDCKLSNTKSLPGKLIRAFHA